ncbi:nucleotidyltransferase domain-containing protein [Dictyobacter aurantiacus]|uniref:Polymerase nucleotidyl transferase domain-containing protein n=1 Tax=Dictyobacter aurantiacus TaxID=1936993 RepID=A0A401ZL79_9CHLR|nr:nucleotidyltransferase domain-containing protein [Dictyobacter aurantiacus]GCE07605.1 hypothetical protein KDAU_49340 [Dictyobacter aurantiacus]
MVQDLAAFPERFHAAVQAIERLQFQDRYLGAFIFGSLARQEATDQSDCDVQVIVDEDNPCANINHPVIGGVKLDLTFLSLAQLKARTQQEMERRERIPMIAESLTVFDKTGQLSALREQAMQVQPWKARPEELQLLQFMFFHGNNKVERNLDADPVTALLAMHVGLDDFLHYHYQIQGRWWVSSKRLLADLRGWDPPLSQLVEQFVTTGELHAKFGYWSAIIDHIMKPIGGRQPIEENNCECAVCRHDLGVLFSQTGDARSN